MERKKRNNGWVYVLVGCLLLIVAVISILLFLMQGRTTTSDNGGTTETVQSMACEGTKIEYPFFKHADDANSSSVNVNAIFDNDKLDRITFVYKLSYKDKDAQEIKQIYDENYMDVAKDFQESGLNTSSLGLKFSKLDDGLQMLLYTNAKGIGGVSSKYLLLDTANGHYKMDNLKKVYEDLGLKCTLNK